MTRRVPGLALPAVVLAWLLFQPVPAGHGSDEVGFLAVEAVGGEVGSTWSQVVPAQGPELSGVELPYRVTGAGDVEVVASISSLAGDQLGRQTLRLHDASWLEALAHANQPYGDGSQVALIDVPPGGSGGIRLRLEVTGGTAALTLFASHGGGPRLPVMDGDGERSLALRTEYGGRAPAIARAGVLLGRAGTWAPPWLPSAVLVLLLIVFAVGGLALAAGRDEQP